MKRDLQALTEKNYDLLVVGGGIHGVMTAWEASIRGLSVCLLERNDFLSATSSNSLKILHGGLRYLQHLDLLRMRESAVEQAFLMRLAPGLIRPLRFVVPTYGHGLRGREAFRTAIWCNDLLRIGLGSIEESNSRLGRFFSREECMDLVPEIETRELTGAASWYECQILNPERLGLAILNAACSLGAQAANYVHVLDFIVTKSRVLGVIATDAISGRTFDVQARVVVNASGPWVDKFISRLKTDKRPSSIFHLSKAMNIVTRQIFPDYAVGIPYRERFRDEEAIFNKGNQLFFIVPWMNRSVIGTRHLPFEGDQEGFAITEQDVDSFLQDLNLAYPKLGLKRSDVIATQGGMVPALPSSQNGHVQLEKHSKVKDHAEDGIEGLISLVGVKWTTARRAAEKAIGIVCRKLGVKYRLVENVRREIATTHPKQVETRIKQDGASCRSIHDDSIHHLATNYGESCVDILSYVSADPRLGERIDKTFPMIGAQITYAVRQEMAQHLGDVIFRRTQLGAAGYPGDSVVGKCAELMAQELGWNAERVSFETVDTLNGFTRAGSLLPSKSVSPAC